MNMQAAGRLFRFSPSRFALGYVALGVLALALFAIPLWHAWRENLSTFRAYVQAEELQRLTDAFGSEGAKGAAAAMESMLGTLPSDQVMILADPSKLRLAGNLPAWPAEVPDAPGTYGLVIGLGGESSMRVVASHATLPGGYHLLMGRESVRFESLVERFWYGIAGAMGIVLVLGAVMAWLNRNVRDKELQRQKAHLDELFDLAPDAVVLTELSPPRILRVNREFTRMFGYRSEEAVGRSLRELIAPAELLEDYAQGAALIASGRKVDKEVVRRRKDGTRFPAHFTAAAIRSGEGKSAAYLVYRDITETKRTQEELKRSEERYALAMEAARDGHWDWIVETDEFYASPQLLEIYGFPADTVFAGRADFLARFPFHPEDKPKWEAAAAAHFAGKTVRFGMELRMLHQGEVRWIRLNGLCLRDAAGTLVRWTGSVRDVTESKRAEAALREFEKQLRQAQRLEAVGTLASGIAHDFNNILGAILGYGEMALRDAPRGSRLKRDLDSVMIAGERGRALVDRVLAFSRSGMVERVAVHVEPIVREVLDQLVSRLPAGVNIESTLHAGRAAILGDATQVHQVLMNLATNSLQAMASGGVLRVSLEAVRVDEPRPATTGRVPAGECLVLTVADSGAGIPSEMLERIFDPFFTTKEAGVGTGLGLSLVHGIVTELGGAVDVRSTPGSGSTFTVYLPRSGEVPHDDEKTVPPMPQGNRERVLIVDDEEPLVALAARTLEGLGYVAVGFTSSSAALEAFRAHPEDFDAVITDERMPGMSGSTLIREVRGIRRAIPILLASGYVGRGVASRAYNSGADEVLKKPLLERDLAASLARVLHS
jgi:PAS domain S-box-containing protein